MSNEIIVKGPDENGMVRVHVPPLDRDCSWIICFKMDSQGKLHYTDLAYTYGLGNKTENTNYLELKKETIEFARREAKKKLGKKLQAEQSQPRLL